MKKQKTRLQRLRDTVICMGYIFLTAKGWELNVGKIEDIVAEIDKLIKEEADEDKV
jgi:hypothetical protein